MKKNDELTLTEKATRAMSEAVAEVIEQHRRQSRPLALWRNGEAVWVPVEELSRPATKPQAVIS